MHNESSGKSEMKLENVSCVLFGVCLAAVGLVLGPLLLHIVIGRFIWGQLIAALFCGAIVGFISATLVLRRKGLPISATIGDVGAAVKREKRS